MAPVCVQAGNEGLCKVMHNRKPSPLALPLWARFEPSSSLATSNRPLRSSHAPH